MRAARELPQFDAKRPQSLGHSGFGQRSQLAKRADAPRLERFKRVGQLRTED